MLYNFRTNDQPEDIRYQNSQNWIILCHDILNDTQIADLLFFLPTNEVFLLEMQPIVVQGSSLDMMLVAVLYCFYERLEVQPGLPVNIPLTIIIGRASKPTLYRL